MPHPRMGIMMYRYRDSIFAVTIHWELWNKFMYHLSDGLRISPPPQVVAYVVDGRVTPHGKDIKTLPTPSECHPNDRQIFGLPVSMGVGVNHSQQWAMDQWKRTHPEQVEKLWSKPYDADHWMNWEEMETIPGRESLSMGRRGDPPPGGHVMMPLTRWTLGYTKSNQEWAPTVGEIVHLDWSCCGMTNPKAILVNEWAVAQMTWCSKCRNKVGIIFGPVGFHFDDSNPHQPDHGYIGRVQRVD